MAIRFKCPKCQSVLTAPNDWQGRQANCKNCQHRFAIPTLKSPANPAAAAPTHSGNRTATSPTARAGSAAPTRSTTSSSTKPALPKATSSSSTRQQAVVRSEVVQSDIVPTEVVRSEVVPTEVVRSEVVRSEVRQPANKRSSVAAPVEIVPVDVVPTEVVTELVPASLPSGTNSRRVQQRPAASSVPSRTKSTQAATIARVLTKQDLEAAFRGMVKRATLPIGYRLSLAAVAIVMLILPVIYVGLIALVAYGGFSWAMHGGQLLSQGGPSSGGSPAGNAKSFLFLYISPIVISVIAVIFMIKPLFARSAKSSKPKSITREEEPVLFDFVARVCKAVGAPIPKRIDLDPEVNASASFRRGWLSLIQPNDLVLTIGMPLVNGLTARELGGVLAHEFGHFSQGMGMRLTYIIRSINYWFARVVYERDRADELLVRWAKNSDYRIGLVLHLGMIMVWLTRKILWVLMMIGNAVSGLLLRQMEYDADRYQIQLAGTQAFSSTFGKLQRLGIAYHQSLEEAQHFFIDGKLVDDLPGLIMVNHDDQPAELIEALDKHMHEEKSNWYDTHPVTRDRIAAAERMNMSGMLHLDEPAQTLFSNPVQLSKDLTRHFFEAAFGDEFKPAMLAPIAELKRFQQSAKNAEEARLRMFGSKFTNSRAMHLAEAQDRKQSEAVSARQMRVAGEKMQAMLPAYETTSEAFDEIDTRWIECHRASTLLGCGVKLKQADWKDLPVDSAESVATATGETLAELARLHEQLLAFEKAFESRVDAAIQWLFTRCRTAPTQELVDLLRQARAVLKCLAMQDRSHRMMLDLRNEFGSMIALFSTVNQGKNLNKAQQAQFELHGGKVREGVRQLAAQFAEITYPFEHAQGTISMAQYLAPAANQVTDTASACEVAHGMLQNYQLVFFRSVGTLAAMIEKVEAAIAAGPVAAPGGQVSNLSESHAASIVSEPSHHATTSASAFDDLPSVEPYAVADSPFSQLDSTIATQTVTKPGKSSSKKWIALGLAATVLLLFGLVTIYLAVQSATTASQPRRTPTVPRNSLAASPANASTVASGQARKLFTVKLSGQNSQVQREPRAPQYNWNYTAPLKYKVKVFDTNKPNSPLVDGQFVYEVPQDQPTFGSSSPAVGVVLDTGGLILTQARSLGGAREVDYENEAGQGVAVVLAIDTKNDLALLGADGGFMQAMRLADSLTSADGQQLSILQPMFISKAAAEKEMFEGLSNMRFRPPRNPRAAREPIMVEMITNQLNGAANATGTSPLANHARLASGCPVVSSTGQLVGLVTNDAPSGTLEPTSQLISINQIRELLQTCQITPAVASGNGPTEYRHNLVRLTPKPENKQKKIRVNAEYTALLSGKVPQRAKNSTFLIVDGFGLLSHQGGLPLPYNFGTTATLFAHCFDPIFDKQWLVHRQREMTRIIASIEDARDYANSRSAPIAEERIVYKRLADVDGKQQYEQQYQLVQKDQPGSPGFTLAGKGLWLFNPTIGATHSLEQDLTYTKPGQSPVQLHVSFEAIP